MNSLYEFGGIADVLIKCKTARNIGGKDYAENEPYTFLTDVNVQLVYEQNVRESNAKIPLGAVRDGRPYELMIGNVPFNKKIADLILTKEENIYNYTKKEILCCFENNKLQLSLEAVKGKEIFCYDENFNTISCELQDDLLTLTGDFIVNENYLVFYTVTEQGNGYNFEIPYFAYFSIEIFGKGNTDKSTENVYMAFDAASLISVPNFNILNGGLFNTPLVFRLIYQNQKEPIIVFN